MNLKEKLLASSLFKDSFWSVFGSGTGSFLLLLAGIFIARMLGKDLYGEYGIVKTTMFYIAAFSTFGLGYTSTKFVAEYISRDQSQLRRLVTGSLTITLLFSTTLCILLFIFAGPLSLYVNAPELKTPFRILGVIIICRALSTTGIGVLAGFKEFKVLGVNNIISGLTLLICGTLFTYLEGINGSLFALFLSQLVYMILNISFIWRRIRILPKTEIRHEKTLLKFSFPVAMQDFSFTLCNWMITLVLTKYASLGELGIWTAAAQWNAIVIFIPSVLTNVALSYLSGIVDDKNNQKKMVQKLLAVNFITSFIPFLIVLLCSSVITSFYGETFVKLKDVISLLLFSTVFESLARVYQSNLISEGRNWLLFTLRFFRDLLILILLFIFIRREPENASLVLAFIHVLLYVAYVIILSVIFYRRFQNSNRLLSI